MPLEQRQFKDALAQWPSGVTVVTTVLEGRFKGTTASSFSSLSLDPMLVMIALGKQLYTHQILSESGVFAVNILRAEQVAIAKMFAGMKPEITDRFAHVAHHTAQTGSPVFDESIGWVDCEIAHSYDGGDHTIFVGRVLEAGVGSGEPLLYHNRRWGHFAQLEPSR